MSRRAELDRVVREWMVGEERHRIVRWRDNTFEHQRIYVEGGVPRWTAEEVSQEWVWRMFPSEAPPHLRERWFLERQEARRRRVWWRRILREAGWR